MRNEYAIIYALFKAGNININCIHKDRKTLSISHLSSFITLISMRFSKGCRHIGHLFDWRVNCFAHSPHIHCRIMLNLGKKQYQENECKLVTKFSPYADMVRQRYLSVQTSKSHSLYPHHSRQNFLRLCFQCQRYHGPRNVHHQTTIPV